MSARLSFLSLAVIFALLVLTAGAFSAETAWLDELDLSKVKQGWGKPGKNRTIDGKPLSIGGRKFARGVGTHAVSSFALDLHGAARRLTGFAGVDDEAAQQEASVDFAIYGDGKRLWRTKTLRSGSAAQALDLDLSGVKQLVLRVGDGGDGNGSDHADWADAKIVYDGQKPTPVKSPPFNWYQPAQPAGKLEIVVQPDDWGDANVRDIQQLVENVAANFLAEFDPSTSPTGRVNVHRANFGPMAVFRETPDEAYKIYLNSKGRLWAQMSYQFAHEFCHLAMNYDRHRGDPHPYKWFHESLCELASLYTMRRMARTWQTAPPYPNWKSYSKALKDYTQNYLDKQERQLPPGVTLEKWYRANQNVLRHNDGIRVLNGVVAHALLPLFERRPEGWTAIRTMPDAAGDFAAYLRAWREATPPAHRPIIMDIAREFGIQLKTGGDDQ